MVGEHPSVLDLRPVAGPDCPAHGHHISIFQNRPHDFFQGIVLEDGIGIHTDKVRIPGGVDAHVQGIGFSAVLFADQGNGHLELLGFKNGHRLLAGDAAVNGPGDLVHTKGLPQELGCLIRGAVIHNDDLVERILQAQQRLDGALDGDLLVVGRNHNGHRYVIVLQKLIFQLIPASELIESGGTHRDRQEEKAGVSDHVQDKKHAHAAEEQFKRIHHQLIKHPLSAFCRSPSGTPSSPGHTGHYL